MTAMSIAAHYDSRAACYDDYSPYHTNLATLFVEYAKPVQNDYILDLACGTGLVTFAMLPHVVDEHGNLYKGQKVIGVDISRGMLDVARRKGDERVEFVEGCIEDLSLIPELEGMEHSFDVVTICSALVLFPAEKLGDLMKHWASYLNPSGRLVVDVPTTSAMLRLRALSEIFPSLGLSMMGDRRWIKTPESLEKLLNEAGLDTGVATEDHNDREWMRTLPARTKVVGRWRKEGEWSVDEADLVLDYGESRPKWFEQLSEERQLDAREMFREAWKRVAREGVVKEVSGLWIAVGRKTEEPRSREWS
jgi:SAM-dependent methyltransferase